MRIRKLEGDCLGRRYDFVGAMYKIKGDWKRESFIVTTQTRSVFRTFGRLFEKLGTKLPSSD